MLRWLHEAKAATAHVRDCGISEAEKPILKALSGAQKREALMADLPPARWFQTVFLAYYHVIRAPQVAALEQSMILVFGGSFSMDFGHTASGCITTNTSAGE